MVRVVVPSQLRSYTHGAEVVEAAGSTLGEVLSDLDTQFPGFRFRVIDEQDRVRRHIILFIGSQRSEDLGEAIPPGKAVQIVGALSGG